MTLRTTLLLMLAAWGSDMRGRTFLQKNAYFMSKLLGQDLGFRPHYYGRTPQKSSMRWVNYAAWESSLSRSAFSEQWTLPDSSADDMTTA